MKFTKYSERGKIEKYVSERTVITFMTGRNKIFVVKRQHGGKREYIDMLLKIGYERKVKAGA
ncbi:MAG: hypothetical protein ACI4MS_08295 [Candidatus Coproplasma sp.]